MVNGPLTAEIGWRVWGTPSNFNELRVLASLLHQCHSTEVNQTLHDVCHLLGWYIIYTCFGGSYLLTEFCQVQNSLCVQFLHSPHWQRYCMALEQWASAKLCGMVQGIELRNFRSSAFSTEGAIYIPKAAITLGIGPHSSSG